MGVYSVDDNFTTSFMTLLSRLPFFPLYYNGDTKFTPIHCSDLTDIIYYIISKNIHSKIVECVGPETFTLKEILNKLLVLINKKKALNTHAFICGQNISKIFSIIPKTI